MEDTHSCVILWETGKSCVPNNSELDLFVWFYINVAVKIYVFNLCVILI